MGHPVCMLGLQFTNNKDGLILPFLRKSLHDLRFLLRFTSFLRRAKDKIKISKETYTFSDISKMKDFSSREVKIKINERSLRKKDRQNQRNIATDFT